MRVDKSNLRQPVASRTNTSPMSAPETILVVEDDTTLLETLTYNLERQGYAVLTATEGNVGLMLALNENPDLIILDIMLPRMDGVEVCRRLRQERNMPVIMLTARSDEVDKIVGLEMGADDYLTKPFSMRELMTRVKAHLRRIRLLREEYATAGAPPLAPAPPAPSMLEFDNLVIDLARREVRLDGNPLQLKPREYDLLVFLARNRGVAVSRDLIMNRVWDWRHMGAGSRTVDVHVRWLREKIEPDPTQTQRIITVRGIGYRFDG